MGKQKKLCYKLDFGQIHDHLTDLGKIEDISKSPLQANKTFNTLKNQGYHLENNFGLGKKYLAAVFAMLLTLAFLIDQTQQLCCPLFRSVWKKLRSKKALWESISSFFRCYLIKSKR